MPQPLDLIYEDADLLVINKPQDLVCHPTKGDEWSSVVGRLRLYLGTENPARLVNRLDRETSGLVVAAKNAEAAGRFGKLLEKRAVEKRYLAVVHGTVEAEEGKIDFALGKDEASIISVKDCVRSDGAAASTEYYVQGRFRRPEGQFTLLEVHPLTGRKHQIRIHLAAIGHPIVGDKLYGGDEDLYLALAQHRLTDEQRSKLILPNQALHAASLEFTWLDQKRHFEAPVPASITIFCSEYLNDAPIALRPKNV